MNSNSVIVITFNIYASSIDFSLPLFSSYDTIPSNPYYFDICKTLTDNLYCLIFISSLLFLLQARLAGAKFTPSNPVTAWLMWTWRHSDWHWYHYVPKRAHSLSASTYHPAQACLIVKLLQDHHVVSVRMFFTLEAIFREHEWNVAVLYLHLNSDVFALGAFTKRLNRNQDVDDLIKKISRIGIGAMKWT